VSSVVIIGWAGAHASSAPEDETIVYPGSVYPAEYLSQYLNKNTNPDITVTVDNSIIKPAPRTPSAKATGETVRHAVQAALTHNPQIAISKSQRDAAKADRFAAFGQFLPDVSVSASYTDDSLRSSSLQTLQDRDGTTFGVTAIQPISQGLSTFNRYRSAKSRANQADLSFLSVRHQVALNAARAHASVVLAREIVDHRISNLGLLNRQFEIVSRRAEAGAQGRTGVEQARVRRAQAQVDLGAARASLADSEAAYARIVGREAPPAFTPDNGRHRSPESIERSIDMAREKNPSVNASEAAFEAAKFSKHAAVGDFAPRVTLEGNYFKRFGATQTLTQEDEEYQLVARLRMPLFNQGRNIADLRSARASVRQAEAELDSTKLMVDEAVTRSWRQLAEAQVSRVAAKQGIEAAEQSVRGLQMEYEAGQRTVIDVLDGQRDLVQAQISLSQAEFDVRVSEYELTAATGSILEAFGVSE